MNATARVPRWILVSGALWLTIAVVVAATGRLAMLAPPRPQLILVGLTILLGVLGGAIPGFRAWLGTLSPRAGIALHVIRFVGFAFLWMAAQGELPREFAVPAGVGDIAVAALAVGLLLRRESPGWYRAALAWNVLGLVDILYVVSTATRVAMADPPSMAPMLHLPMSLLPTFLVPVIIASHVWLFVRLRGTALGRGR
jgi:hypothetical protein